MWNRSLNAQEINKELMYKNGRVAEREVISKNKREIKVKEDGRDREIIHSLLQKY